MKKPGEKVADQEEWKNRLSENCGSISFMLTLTKRQVQFLQMCRDGRENTPVMAAYSHYVPTYWSLFKKGLVESGGEEGHVLTPAGDLVVQLLVYSGQIEKPRVRAMAA